MTEAVCNAHALLKFRAIKDAFPVEYGIAGEVYKTVFDNDDEAKAQGLAPLENHRDLAERTSARGTATRGRPRRDLRRDRVEQGKAVAGPLAHERARHRTAALRAGER